MGKSRLSHDKQERLIEHFVSGSTSLAAARLCGVNRKTPSYFFLRLREIIALELEVESEAMFGGEVEVDESYFGGRRKGRRGRGAGGKIPVFGLLKRGGKVYTKIIPNASSATLMPIMERKIEPDTSSIPTVGRATTCSTCQPLSYFRINHWELFTDKQNHINGIKNVWNQGKRHMRKFNGVPKAQFGLFLKECELRFNNSDPLDQLSPKSNNGFNVNSDSYLGQPLLFLVERIC